MPPKKPSPLLTSLKSAAVEKDVENAYRAAIGQALAAKQATCTSPYGTDGYWTWGDVRLLLEVKQDIDMRDRAQVCRVIGQCLLYVARFVAAGEAAPNVVMIADRNEVAVLPLAVLQGFLALPIDWTTAPSKGSPELQAALVSGLNLLPHVFDVGKRFDIAAVIERVEALAQGESHRTRATLANIGTIFDHWRTSVFKGGLGPVDQVDVFLRCLFEPVDVYPHPKRKNTLVVPGYPDGVAVHTDRYQTFFDAFVQGYRPSEIEAFYAAKDRLIDDDARRRQGAFFTPRIWVDEAHRTIESVLGPAWRDECIVWDPAAGTGNLTRDYAFADLIISTAERSDADTIKAQGYNPGASIFQYDFLNPDAPSPFFPDGERSTIPPHVDAQLRAAAKAGKRLVFLMNPPYGTAGIKGVSSRAGIADTYVNQSMRAAKMGKASSQLYMQFMYRAVHLAATYGFTEYTIGMFSKSAYVHAAPYNALQTWLVARARYCDGFMFQASHFADVSSAWGILFALWSEGTTRTPGAVRLLDASISGVCDVGTKELYRAHGRDASTWVAVGTRGVPTIQFKSGLAVSADKLKAKLPAAAFGSLNNHGNSPAQNAVVFLLSGGSSDCGTPLVIANFRRCMALFAARKLVTGTWINDKDEYLAPDETRPGYAQWVDDAHVYALLHPSNNCTAMREVEYKGKSWTISNHLFWRSRARCLADLDTSDTLALYRDCKATPAGYVVPPPDDASREPWEVAGDPYLAHVLPSLDLSPEARDVLAKLDALWFASLPVREAFAVGRPELHLGAWDAGVYQLKHLWREHFPAEWEALRTAHRLLADRLRPGVYDFGFLLR